MSSKKYQELEDIVLENTILIKKNRALVSINHDNLHGAYRESYDVTRELLLLQLERARKFIDEKTTHINLFEYLKKRIEINKKTASVTEKIITSNETKPSINIPLENSILSRYDVGVSTLNLFPFFGPLPISLCLCTVVEKALTLFADPNKLINIVKK